MMLLLSGSCRHVPPQLLNLSCFFVFFYNITTQYYNCCCVSIFICLDFYSKVSENNHNVNYPIRALNYCIISKMQSEHTPHIIGFIVVVETLTLQPHKTTHGMMYHYHWVLSNKTYITSQTHCKQPSQHRYVQFLTITSAGC
jgi:hypothetical protein